jgi:hypothetical protein
MVCSSAFSFATGSGVKAVKSFGGATGGSSIFGEVVPPHLLQKAAAQDPLH